MSIQSLDNQSPIWQNRDLGPDSSLIYVDNSKFDLVENLEKLSNYLIEIEEETQCLITVHGQWIKIKNNSSDSRRTAIKLINTVANNSCKEIFLPKPVDEKTSTVIPRLSSPSPPPNENTSSNTFSESPNFLNLKYLVPNQSISESESHKRGLTRSTTESQICSLQNFKSNSSSPFSVLGLPLTTLKNKSNAILEEEGKNPNDLLSDNFEIISEINGNGNDKGKRKQYSIDFLLLRSDVPSSKKLPSNWKSLSEKFPLFCFCGKVLSYFNPYKYHEHWDKVKNQNYELHNSLESPIMSPRYQNSNYYKKNYNSKTDFNNNQDFKAHTDDYLNLQNTHNYPTNNKFRNNEFQKSNFFNYNNNETVGGYENNMFQNGHRKYNNISFDQRQNQFQQNQAYYQQENQIKRKTQKANFINQKVYE